jgi:uncharacterized membrane protein YbaN (DUF454 family)
MERQTASLPAPVPVLKNGAVRILYFTAGIVMLVLGVAGVALPLLPATPFLLAAAWLLGRSSPQLERWLLEHKVFGATLRNWRRDRAIAPRTKLVAVACMAISFAVMLPGGTPLIAKIAVGLFLICCATFVASRPSPRPVTEAID